MELCTNGISILKSFGIAGQSTSLELIVPPLRIFIPVISLSWSNAQYYKNSTANTLIFIS